MSGLIPGLRFLCVNKKANLIEERLLYELTNLRELKIWHNVLCEALLNKLTRQFKYLTVLWLQCDKIPGNNLRRLPNYSVRVLLISRCTCSDLNVVKSFRNLKSLYLHDTKLKIGHLSVLRSLEYLTLFGHGILRHYQGELVLSRKKASTVEKMYANSRNLSSISRRNCIRFGSLDEFIQYLRQTNERDGQPTVL